MNKTRTEAVAFATQLQTSSVANSLAIQPFVVPPFPYLAEVSGLLQQTKVKVGAQNMHWEAHGAWTGEVSAEMIADCGASLVELGHSERRTFFNETDETVALKVRAAVDKGLIALVCIGDTKEEYEAGQSSAALERQTLAALSKVQGDVQGKVIFAYEPVWSIGDGGSPADPDFVNVQHSHIKALTERETGTALPVVYGGSVNQDNCCAFMRQPLVNGLFIGRAAWDVVGYIGIAEKVIADRS